MVRRSVRVVETFFVARKIIIKEIRRNIDADHVPDIEIAYHGQRKEDDKSLVFVVFDELFNGQREQRQPHHRIDPH